MADAVISRGGTSVTVPLIAEGGSLAVARDVGKPTATITSVGAEDPLPQDYFNAGDAFTFAGELTGSSAYADAKTLAEDLIKTRAQTSTPLQLDLSSLPNKSTYDVAPVGGRACVLSYSPGARQIVGVQCTLSVVSTTIGGSQNTQSTQSPDAGDGIKLDRDGTSVTLTSGLTVQRQVGRTNAELVPRPDDLPTFIDHNEPAEDVFDISGALVSANAESDADTLESSIVRPRLGDAGLTLHFQDNLLGLDAYTVFPEGSQAVRTVWETGVTGVVDVPTLSLRVVDPA